MGRWTMVTGWIDLFKNVFGFGKAKKEFVSVDARYEVKSDIRSYEMLSRETSAAVTPVSPVASPRMAHTGRQTPDYFGQTARYHAPSASYSSPRPPQRSWDPQETFARPNNEYDYDYDSNVNPLSMNRI